MANYTDKVIRDQEPKNIKHIKAWRKEFCTKYTDDDIEILNKYPAWEMLFNGVSPEYKIGI